MLTNQCPACWRENADDAANCSVCGAHLGAVDTVRLPLQSSVGPASRGALWLDDLVAPPAGSAPEAEPGPASVEPPGPVEPLTPLEPQPPQPPEPPPLELTLRDIGMPAAPDLPADNAAPASALVQSDGATPWPVLEPADIVADVDGAAQRAERRAAVRRDRRASASAASVPSIGAAEVMVVGDTPVANNPLCSLLQTFGFTVHATADAAEALARAASPTLLASFVHAEVSDSIALCGRLRQANAQASAHTSTQASERGVLLVLVTAKLRPTDRVRAELAGCDDSIATPITRGSVARLLDARGIRLPADPRQA